jgi:hypothetical protein
MTIEECVGCQVCLLIPCGPAMLAYHCQLYHESDNMYFMKVSNKHEVFFNSANVSTIERHRCTVCITLKD